MSDAIKIPRPATRDTCRKAPQVIAVSIPVTYGVRLIFLHFYYLSVSLIMKNQSLFEDHRSISYLPNTAGALLINCNRTINSCHAFGTQQCQEPTKADCTSHQAANRTQQTIILLNNFSNQNTKYTLQVHISDGF